jgi:DNA mismatch repair ATPase MutS
LSPTLESHWHHRPPPVPADRSYGIHVAKLTGLPAAVIEQAKLALADRLPSRLHHRVEIARLIQ